MSYKDLTVLVTGGAGFIGSNLVDALLEAGARVRVLDNLFSGKQSNLDAARYFGKERFEFLEGDICNSHITCQKACEGVDIVFHEAAFVSVPLSMKNPLTNHHINITGTLHMLMAAAEAGVKRFVFASSGSTYGELPELPKVETQSRDYPSLYALSKGVCEDYAALFARKEELGHGMTCVGLRYFNVYGPRQDPKSPYSGVISIFTDNILKNESITVFGDGEATRDFVFVGDVVQANVLAGVAELPQGLHMFNVGTGKSTSILQLADTLKSIVGNNVPMNFATDRTGDMKHSVADIAKIKTALGYEPKYSLEAGLRALIASYPRQDRHSGKN
jgi:UDP-N-acetylglucosamine/UDP-N-acetylgalactosamine 4-epimerase